MPPGTLPGGVSIGSKRQTFANDCVEGRESENRIVRRLRTGPASMFVRLCPPASVTIVNKRGPCGRW